MADNENSTEQQPTTAASRREDGVKASVASLFRHCSQSKNPVLAFSRACSKVGYLARDGVRGQLFYLTSALNEQKHALLSERLGAPDQARVHVDQRNADLHSLALAVRREIAHPRQPPSTPELRQRIHDNLDAGHWSRARADLEQLSKRPDIGRKLPNLSAYPQSALLHEEHYQLLQDRIDGCNAAALTRRSPAPDRDRVADTVPSAHLSASARGPSHGLGPRSQERSESVHHRSQTVATPDRSKPLAAGLRKDRGLDR